MGLLPDQAVTVGFDIGGTNIRAGLVDASGQILDTVSARTPHTAQALDDAIVDMIAELEQRFPSKTVAGVGLAVAGFIDPSASIVRFAPHLPWRDSPVRERLSARLGCPVTLEHDANSAAWGEYRFGAARDADIWVLFAIGTGIGATLMINGTIYRGAYGTAPEFGHLVVVPEGVECPCGKRGCLERYLSGTALVTTARRIAEEGVAKESELSRRLLSGEDGAGSDVTGRDITEAAHAGDPVAVATVADFTRWLGKGLSIVADVVDPELIVIGGGVSQSSELWLDQAVEAMGRDIVGAGYRPLPRVNIASLGTDAGMIGVADLARSAALSAQA